MTQYELRRERKAQMFHNYDIFAERLNQIMKERNVTKAALEQDGVVSIDQIYSYLKGQKMPRTNTLQVMCSYMGVSADYLLGLSNVKDPLKGWIFTNGMWCCPYCGGAGEANNKFCPNCGKRIDVE